MSNANTVRIGKLGGGQIRGINLDHGQVAAIVSAYGAVKLPSILQFHRNLIGAGDHMVVGQHPSIGPDDDAAAAALGAELARESPELKWTVIAGAAETEATEEIFETRHSTPGLHGPAGPDGDNSRQNALTDGNKAILQLSEPCRAFRQGSVTDADRPGRTISQSRFCQQRSRQHTTEEECGNHHAGTRPGARPDIRDHMLPSLTKRVSPRSHISVL